MSRLFVAIKPPMPLRRQLLGTMGLVSSARWQSDEQLHLTLAFLGEVDGAAAEALDTALALICADPIPLRLAGTGSFSSRGRVHSLWIGAEPRDALAALAKKVTRAARQAGIAVEERAFVPHITVARLNASCGPVDSYLQQWSDLSSKSHRVGSFGLYESQLGQGGSAYQLLADYRLSA